MTTNWPFLFSGVYGVFLGVLILSWHVTPVEMRRFVADSYSLGTHGQVWANWHAMGCLFVGAVNLMVVAGRFNDPDARHIAVASLAIYGVWCLQNLQLVLARPRQFKPLMWLNVIACAIAASGALSSPS